MAPNLFPIVYSLYPGCCPVLLSVLLCFLLGQLVLHANPEVARGRVGFHLRGMGYGMCFASVCWFKKNGQSWPGLLIRILNTVRGARWTSSVYYNRLRLSVTSNGWLGDLVEVPSGSHARRVHCAAARVLVLASSPTVARTSCLSLSGGRDVRVDERRGTRLGGPSAPAALASPLYALCLTEQISDPHQNACAAPIHTWRHLSAHHLHCAAPLFDGSHRPRLSREATSTTRQASPSARDVLMHGLMPRWLR